MKKFLLGTVGLIALGISAPASAADLAARPYTKAPPMVAAIYDWSGFYVGANGGYGSSRKCFDSVGFVGFPTAAVRDNCGDATGGLAGGQIGYRWQSASWVFGLEAQGDWADLKGSSPSTLLAGVTEHVKINGIGLFTGQVGYAWNNVLFYVKGGAAVVGDHYRTSFTAGDVLISSASETRWGGTVGAGLEFGFAPNWSVGFEYDHLFMGSRDLAFSGPLAPPPVLPVERIHQDVDMATIRVNYRFGGPIVAKY
ncbi:MULTISPECIES: outer membrane protein [Bradyrhizobium]|jgi:outer membrane immunogenic protein|uniref:Outer membrane immunogenic protein n=2 Tax=Bradyrhizobium TaxID=374 RepID=A0ABY0Q6S7_9BRAD|nr:MULTISPECIES: outer membrane beta-barrel protein [Bradyrhizobium]SDJ59726.1 outer membrane immunogenic protein [Bradyrhizobium ottawaense]SEC38551.1 outer membrane immunogenic protein [Bradyrhizobium lablabi]